MPLANVYNMAIEASDQQHNIPEMLIVAIPGSGITTLCIIGPKRGDSQCEDVIVKAVTPTAHACGVIDVISGNSEEYGVFPGTILAEHFRNVVGSLPHGFWQNSPRDIQAYLRRAFGVADKDAYRRFNTIDDKPIEREKGLVGAVGTFLIYSQLEGKIIRAEVSAGDCRRLTIYPFTESNLFLEDGYIKACCREYLKGMDSEEVEVITRELQAALNEYYYGQDKLVPWMELSVRRFIAACKKQGIKVFEGIKLHEDEKTAIAIMNQLFKNRNLVETAFGFGNIEERGNVNVELIDRNQYRLEIMASDGLWDLFPESLVRAVLRSPFSVQKKLSLIYEMIKIERDLRKRKAKDDDFVVAITEINPYFRPYLGSVDVQELLNQSNIAYYLDGMVVDGRTIMYNSPEYDGLVAQVIEKRIQNVESINELAAAIDRIEIIPSTSTIWRFLTANEVINLIKIAINDPKRRQDAINAIPRSYGIRQRFMDLLEIE